MYRLHPKPAKTLANATFNKAFAKVKNGLALGVSVHAIVILGLYLYIIPFILKMEPHLFYHQVISMICFSALHLFRSSRFHLRSATIRSIDFIV